MGSIRPDPNLLKKHPNAVTLDQLQEKDRFLGALEHRFPARPGHGGLAEHQQVRDFFLTIQGAGLANGPE